MRELQPLVMENVTILPGAFKNFAGKRGPFNKEGDRMFNVAVPEEVGAAMQRDGWLVKSTKPRENDDPRDFEPTLFVPVAVSYKIRPPKIFLVTKRGKTPIGEGEVAMLDWVEITYADVILNPHFWDVDGKTGIKAYLGELYATIEENPLTEKYADTPTSAR